MTYLDEYKRWKEMYDIYKKDLDKAEKTGDKEKYEEKVENLKTIYKDCPINDKLKELQQAKKELNEYDRHIEHSEIFENNLEARALNKQIPTDEIVENKINNEKLRDAIQELPKIQRERLKKYYFENKTFEEIESKIKEIKD